MRNCIFPVLFFFSFSVFAQAPKGSLSERWSSTIENAENYEFYKVIKKSELNELWRIIQDSVGSYKSQIKQERLTVKTQNDTISSLRSRVNDLAIQVSDAKTSTNSIGFMGKQVNKYAYTTFLWILLIIAIAGCGFLFFIYNASNRITQQAIGEYKSLSSSFDEYKVNKIEMERKLKREIQTQANKLEELKKK